MRNNSFNWVKRHLSRLEYRSNKWVYLPIKKNIEQERKGFRAFSLSFIVFIEIIMSLLFLIDQIGTFSLKDSSMHFNYRYIYLGISIFCLWLISVSVWLILTSKYSPIKNWKIRSLLKQASSDLDLLRHHESYKDEEPVRTIHWFFKYDPKVNQLLLKLFLGAHISKEKSQKIPRSLANFLIKTTHKNEEWNIADSYINDEEGCLVILFGPSRKRLILDSLEKVSNKDGMIPLDSQLFFDPRKQIHMIIVGKSGSGKTTLLKVLILSILSDKRNTLFICDGKRSYLYTLGELNKSIETSSNGEDLLEMLEKLSTIINHRYQKVNEVIDEEKDLTYLDLFPDEGHVYFVFDEMLTLLTIVESTDKSKKPVDRLFPKIQAQLTYVLQLGRAANVHVVISGQQLPSKIIDTSSREAMGARLTLGAMDPSNAIEIFNMGEKSLPSIDTSNYSALVWLDGLGWEYPKPLLLPYFDEEKLRFKRFVADYTK